MDKINDKKLDELLSIYKAPEPRADYKERFWGKLVGRKQVEVTPLIWFKWAFGLGAIGMLLFGVVIFNQIQIDGQMARLTADQVQMLAHVDVAENFDLLQDFNIISNLDEIEEIENQGMV